MITRRLRMSWSLLLLISAGSCGDDGSSSSPDAAPELDAGHVGVSPAPADEPWDRLSEWGLFEDIAEQTPSARVLPYTVNAQLYADETDKHRFVWIPEGTAIEYRSSGPWRFPEGTILVKTFSYARSLAQDADEPERRLLETRLLVRGEDRWHAHTYVYEDGSDDARRVVAGRRMDVRFVDAEGDERDNRYAVPNTNQCGECHGKDDAIDTLGGTTRQWNRAAPDGEENQIERLIALGWLEGAEPEDRRQALADPFGDAPLGERMRAYVDANCGHCHNDDEDSGDDGSGLWLRYDLTDPADDPRATLGLCKMPQSAGGATCGLTLDVVPGDPDASIFMCRVESEEEKVQMPPVGRNLHDARGAALLREWIASLEGGCE